jgi:hypothetical protein
MSTINVLDAAGATVPIEKPLAPGRAAAGASRPVALSNEDAAFLDGIEGLLTTIDGRVDGLEALIGATNTKIDTLNTAVASTVPSPVQAKNPDYETAAASATDQIMGTTGAAGDYLSHVIIQPTTTSPGNVIIKDGSTTILTFPGGASSVTTLAPFMVPLGLTAATAWKITTGANVSAVGVGDFT